MDLEKRLDRMQLEMDLIQKLLDPPNYQTSLTTYYPLFDTSKKKRLRDSLEDIQTESNAYDRYMLYDFPPLENELVYYIYTHSIQRHELHSFQQTIGGEPAGDKSKAEYIIFLHKGPIDYHEKVVEDVKKYRARLVFIDVD